MGLQPGVLSLFLVVRIPAGILTSKNSYQRLQCKLIAGASVTSFNAWQSLNLSLRLQGHALMTRHSGSANPCPVIDFDAGFNAWMAYAYGLPKGTTVADKFGKPFGNSPTPPPPPC